MDKSFIIPVCLHGGAININELEIISAGTQFEKQFNLVNGCIYSALKAISNTYGAIGIAAVDNCRIVGICRFYPVILIDLLNSIICPQEENAAKRLAVLYADSLTPLDKLEPKALFIACYQIIEEFQGKGIGKAFLNNIISWAKENHWTEIYCEALEDIHPILTWSGNLSDKMLKGYGFEVIDQIIDTGIKEAANHMRLGYHGEAVKKEWETKYCHISPEHEYYRYKMKLSL